MLFLFQAQQRCWKYVPKGIPFQYSSFICRALLTGLDHNIHCFRPQVFERNGKQIFKRKYSKRTERWHAQPVKVAKTYRHNPLLIARILKSRKLDTGPMTRQFVSLENDPKNLHPTIAVGKVPPVTEKLIPEGKSRKWTVKFLIQIFLVLVYAIYLQLWVSESHILFIGLRECFPYHYNNVTTPWLTQRKTQ